MADSDPKSYDDDPTTLYLYTSLTAGSSHIITATSRVETILNANKIPFRGIDVATDEPARNLWGRRSKGKKLPALVRDGMVIADLDQIEEWNEYGEIKMQLGSVPSKSTSSHLTAPTTTNTSMAISPRTEPQGPIPTESSANKDDQINLTSRQAAGETASKGIENTRANLSATPLTGNKAEETTAQNVPNAPEENTGNAEPATKGDWQPIDLPKFAPERIREIRQSILALRPSLSGVPAELSADVKVDSPEAQLMPRHHRGSVVSATSPRGQNQLVKDLSAFDDDCAILEEEDVEESETKTGG
ncbi:hypothetical protein PAAG_01633 [Paracoccidioides lutzii Pb01]|uniref:Uncharacterized protein n=1 Tax=Paracoccidioides lutzii (strain ATCC MYA-826 / Pb01) TaxID=502779 RepID=C1GSY8_PARBA|nr:hypothetical protein PAAG_01633 [Paracoccidioides lutzii Pb01]EEH39171.1 hypothetical protein PAAG_01633 [Paracoccidioides lutzii Pb01]